MRSAEIRGLRGIDVEDELQALDERFADSTEVQAQASVDEVRALVALAGGDWRSALDLARRSYERSLAPDATAPQTATRAAAWLRESSGVREALTYIEEQTGRVPAAIRREAEAALAALDGRGGEALAAFVDAIRRWRELGLHFEAAVCALNLVTMLGPIHPRSACSRRRGASAVRARAAPSHFSRAWTRQ